MEKLFLLALLMSSSVAFSRDSEWMLCKGETVMDDDVEKLVLSSFEHRSGASTRATDLTLIFGGYTLTGSFDSTNNNAGKVKLKQKNYSFIGDVAINYADHTIKLKGNLNLVETYAINTKFNCEVLRD